MNSATAPKLDSTLDYATLGLLQEGVWVSDRSDRLVFVNAAMAKLAGLDAAQMTGLDLHAFPEATLRHFLDFFERARTTLAPCAYECPVVTPTGRATWQGGWLTPLLENGRYAGMLCTASDISERIHAQKQLENSKARYRTLVDALPQRIWRQDRESVVVGCNLAFARALGGVPTEMVGKAPEDWRSPEQAARHRAEDARIMATGISETLEETTRVDGQARWTLTTKLPLRDAAGQVTGLIAISNDITERKRLESHLRESQETLHRAQRIGRIGSYTRDGVGESFHLSPEAARLFDFGARRDVSVEEVFSRIHPDDQAAVETTWHAALQGTAPDSVYRIVVRGQVVWIQEKVEFVRDAQAQLEKMLGTVQDVTDLIQAQELLAAQGRQLARALARSDELLHLAMEGANVGLWYWPMPDGTPVWSDLCRKILALPDDREPSLEHYLSVMHPEDRPRVEALYQDALERGGDFQAEYRIVLPDGAIRWVSASGRVFVGPDGEATGMGGVVTDITPRKQSEQVLHRYEMLAAYGRDIILFIRREDGRLLEANAAAVSTYGYPRDALLDMRIHDLRAPEARSDVDGQMCVAADRGIRFETVHRRRDGSTFPVEVTSQGMRIGTSETLISVIRDITDQRAREAENLRLRDIITEAPDFIGTTTLEGVPTYLNPAGRRLLGVGPDAPLHRHMLDIFPEDEQALLREEILPSVLREGHWRGELSAQGAGARQIPVETYILLHRDADGRPVRLTGIMRDLSERRRHEQEAQLHIEMMQALAQQHVVAQTGAAIAHELNQPLMAIAAYTEAGLMHLKHGHAPADPAARAIERSREQALRAGKVLHELIDHLRTGEIQQAPFDLGDLIRMSLGKLHKRSPLAFRLQLELAPGLPAVLGNPLQSEKVLANLVQNGLQSMVAAGMAEVDRVVSVHAQALHDRVQVTVRDNGPGMGPGVASHIFDPFFSTKVEGLGLGLAISRSLAEVQGGELWHDPEAGPGATFRFTLPFAPLAGRDQG